MSFAEYADYDGLGLAELIRNRDVTPSELLEAAIERIERNNGKLNAVVHKAYDEARGVAAGTLPDGPFKGVPFLIKDLGVRVKGWPRTSASRFAQIDADDSDSELITRYRATGAVLAGKTNTPEFGIPGVTTSALLGPCRNPWNTDHITGGSSGGAAAAVAAGMVPLAHASDGLGSIRIPAACCGLVGMKTTRDRNPNGQHDTDRAIGLSVDHVVSRTVRDSAAMLDATGYPEGNSPFAYPAKERPYVEEIARGPGKLRIGWSSETPRGEPIEPEIRAALERTAEALGKLGHDVRKGGLGIDYRALYRAQGLVSASNFAAGIKRWIEIKGREPGDDIEGLARRAYEAGKKISGQDAMWGWQQLRLMNREILSKFETWDVWLTPVLSTNVPRVEFLDTLMEDLKEFDRRQATTFGFTPPFNLTGQPSLSLPLWQSESGLPIGMMFTGRYADEGTLYRLAGQLEKELPWAVRKPPVWN
ncbi:amidase [Terricaulis silvestris]|uniref:6-aminohexanoate-cyclic-dimer hydrolase n=1 Tax=Terricaulis silvestris TaxID=2686094 RepID=A0A6I6MRU3_9CAUL|nr:amidase [Terricaulis silvestris]QGZ94362.1 6-aminohexanoate-cyclic-dimer hydrolase [Terricaulis silvestris]